MKNNSFSTIFSTKEILDRLLVLQNKLDAEGLYVSSNTIRLAIERINDQASLIEAIEKEANK